jgi:surface protein
MKTIQNHNNDDNNNYEILEKLKINNYLSIYKILNKKDNKIYSLRKIALNAESKEALEKIKNEVKVLISINNEYIIKYVNCLIIKNTFNILTEYYEELNLRQFINKYRKENKLIKQNLIYHFLKEICLGLKEIHNNNLIHRNLSPDNIYFTKENKLKIGGFGIFRQLNNYNEYILSKNNYYNYIAPEIIKEEEENKKNDIWSLGCILHELCTLHYCFNSNNIIKLQNKIICKNNEKIDLKFYDSELQNLIWLLLKKNYNERPNIEKVYELVSEGCDIKTEKKFEKKGEKSKIKMIIDIKENDINKDIYFLDNTDYEDENGNKHFHDSIKEFNELNTKLYINNKKYRFQKYFRFAEKGEYYIKIKFYFSVKDCSNMFYNCNSIKSIDLSSFNARNVSNMSNMFFNCDNLTNINFSNFNTENVIIMSNMFCQCYNLENINISSFNTNNVINMSGLFQSCDKLINLNLSNFNTQKVIDMSNMFSYCNKLQNLDLSLFKTENVKNMARMFYMCENLNNIDLTSFDTRSVNNMSEMFCYCENLENLNLLSFNVKNACTMEKMFYNCKNLKNIDLSSFNSEKVSDISRMFCECKNLESINLSSFNIKSVNNCFQTFYNCKKLKKIKINKETDFNSFEKEFKLNNIIPEIVYI